MRVRKIANPLSSDRSFAFALRKWMYLVFMYIQRMKYYRTKEKVKITKKKEHHTRIRSHVSQIVAERRRDVSRRVTRKLTDHRRVTLLPCWFRFHSFDVEERNARYTHTHTPQRVG